MQEIIEDFITQLQKRSGLKEYDEARTKQAIILPLLQKLNWDPFNVDEVTPEFSIGSQRVDYCLRFDKSNKVFLEVKKCESDLEKHQEQILNYSFKEGVELAILTNGITWWFYLPLKRGSWDQRKFYTIDIYQQNVKEISDFFITILSKEYVKNGSAIKYAENIHENKHKTAIIQDALPEIWNNIIKEPNDFLVEIIADETERKTGYKPDILNIKEFIKENETTLTLRNNTSYKSNSQILKNEKEEFSNKNNSASNLSSYMMNLNNGIIDYTNFKAFENYQFKPSAFKFNEKTYEVQDWIDILKKICDLIYTLHRNDIEKLFQLHGSKRNYFSYDKNKVDSPYQINLSNIYAMTKLGTKDIIYRCYKILNLFGYSYNSLTIYYRN